jgi:hypothetical protein
MYFLKATHPPLKLPLEGGEIIFPLPFKGRVGVGWVVYKTTGISYVPSILRPSITLIIS